MIEDFIAIYGDTVANDIYQYMKYFELLDEFDKASKNLVDLFDFAVNYGILDIVRYLYIYKNIEYNHSMLTQKTIAIKSENGKSVGATSTNSNTQINIQFWDKFTERRNKCIEYLIIMKRYSTMRNRGKIFWYKFNSKYTNCV